MDAGETKADQIQTRIDPKVKRRKGEIVRTMDLVPNRRVESSPRRRFPLARMIATTINSKLPAEMKAVAVAVKVVGVKDAGGFHLAPAGPDLARGARAGVDQDRNLDLKVDLALNLVVVHVAGLGPDPGHVQDLNQEADHARDLDLSLVPGLDQDHAPDLSPAVVRGVDPKVDHEVALVQELDLNLDPAQGHDHGQSLNRLF